jgi:hypothetical protein
MATPLYIPREIRVLTTAPGEPLSVYRGHHRKKVARILNSWRIDDEWWREPLSRQYFQVELQDGVVLTVFRDLISGIWYQQRY